MTPTPEILTYLRDQGHTRASAARALGIHREQLRRLLDRYAIEWQLPSDSYRNGIWQLGIRVSEWQAMQRAVDRDEAVTGNRDQAIRRVAHQHHVPCQALAAFDAGEWERLD